MGNAPSEANKGSWLRCWKCHNVLPACTSFNDYYKQWFDGRQWYVYNGGQYYRPVGADQQYHCSSCFHNERSRVEQQRRAEERRREEERRRQEEERRKLEEKRRQEEERIREEARKRKEEQRRRELDQRLERSHQRAQEKYEQQLVTEDHKYKQQVVISHLNEFEPDPQSERGDREELIRILSTKCNVPITNLCLSQLTADQLKNLISALGDLLFDDWIHAPPSLSILQHCQVFVTELCVQSMDMDEGTSLQNIADDMQSFVETVSKSACSVSESFLLTKALYQNLLRSISGQTSSDTDAILIAKQWAEEDLQPKDLCVLHFLNTLMQSLQTTRDNTSDNTCDNTCKSITDMEIQCLKHLLMLLDGKESHSKTTEVLLRFVQTEQWWGWTPSKAMILLRKLSEKYADSASIIEALALIDVYNIAPDRKIESGQTFIQALDNISPEKFLLDLRNTLRKQDESNLEHELKSLSNMEDSVIDIIRNVTVGVLQYSENYTKGKAFKKESLKCTNFQNLETIQDFLIALCQAVFDTKSFWPTVQHMVRWCALVLMEKNNLPELVGLEEESCVTAMFAATVVCKGNKVDLVLSSDGYSYEQTKYWSDFYEHLGISFNSNLKQSSTSWKDVYESDIVYGTMDIFVSDYFQCGLEVINTGKTYPSRGFITDVQSLCTDPKLHLPNLREDERMFFAAQTLQNLLGGLQRENIELRKLFIQSLLQVLRNNLKEASIITTISKICSEKKPSSDEIYILSFFEMLLKTFHGKTESNKKKPCALDQLCLQSLCTCAMKFQDSKQQTIEHFQMVCDLVAQQLWSPLEALSLLVTLLTDHNGTDMFILKLLHLMKTYRISSKWTDEGGKSLLELLKSDGQDVLDSFRKEKEKSIDNLVEEIRQMECINEDILTKSYNIVKNVKEMIDSNKMTNYKDPKRAKTLSTSTDPADLQEVLAILCKAVHENNFEGKWWPRITQMFSWCLLVLSDNGKLLEMGTGEGKSCVIAMFAALRALRGEKVDVVSSSSVLCQRDAKEWEKFYSHFGLTVDTNTDKSEDEERKECYKKNVVYGTIEAFAADHLRQIFEMKDVRPDRGFQCVIIDEVDSLLLDQGVQLTYLSSPMVSMQHLNIVLAMIWVHTSYYSFLSTEHQTFVCCPQVSFFKAIFDSIDTEGSEIEDPTDILYLAEQLNIVHEGFTEEIFKSNKDDFLQKLKTVDQESVVSFFRELENYLPYSFTLYTLDDSGVLHLLKPSANNNNPDIPELKFLVMEDGLCSILYDSEDILIKPIKEIILEKIHYTNKDKSQSDDKEKVSVPSFLEDLIKAKVSVWIQNAFLALRLCEGQEYVVENDAVCPVDFRSTGLIELNKKWGDGLQQFVEIKHRIKLSTISTVTNYISNNSFFEKYKGQIYGTTGTLGSETDMKFVKTLYPNLSECQMPPFNSKKLFEVPGILKFSAEEWKSEIKEVVMAEISPNVYRDGRAALVICETINKAKEIYEDLKGTIPRQIILYYRSDKDSLSKIERELFPGDVIVATNLAGRGTDIKVSKEVNNSGGLFVVLSFLSENTRVERQAFGRTARKGKPGSAQIIMTTEHVSSSLRSSSSLEIAKSTRESLAVEKIKDMEYDITEMKLREDLFTEYCQTLKDVHQCTDKDQEKRDAVVAIMNEFWGIWLQNKSDMIDQLKRDELFQCLVKDLSKARDQCEKKTSPCSSIYHYIKFGNIAMDKKNWNLSMSLFKSAMVQDESWAAIAFYNHAYCTIMSKGGNYLTNAIEDLKNAQHTLKHFSEECVTGLKFVTLTGIESADNNQSSLEKQFESKCKMFGCFEKNISEAIEKLKEIKGKERDATAEKSAYSSLVTDHELKEEAYNMYQRGLKYVFAVKEEPRFPWEALTVFFLGVLQVIAGALLTVVSFGTLAQVGVGLISEGVSDIITGIEGMITGTFSWVSWAIDKAVSIGLSLIGFGVAKLVSKGLKLSSLLAKGAKNLKSLPKLLGKTTKQSLSTVMKTTMKTAVKSGGKALLKKLAEYGFDKACEAIMTQILEGIKDLVRKDTRINDEVKSNLEKDPLAASIDSFILSQLEDKEQLSDLMTRRNRELLEILKTKSQQILHSCSGDLDWQSKLNSSISSLIREVKGSGSSEVKIFLTALQAHHMAAMAATAFASVVPLSGRFFSKLHVEIKELIESPQKVKPNDLSAADKELLKKFKEDLTQSITDMLADTLVDVFHQQFTGEVVSLAQSKLKSVTGEFVKNNLTSEKMKKRLHAAKQNRVMKYMPLDWTSKGESYKGSKSHEKTSFGNEVGRAMGVEFGNEVGRAMAGEFGNEVGRAMAGEFGNEVGRAMGVVSPFLEPLKPVMSDLVKDYATEKLKEICGCAE